MNAWNNFNGGNWENEINVRDFIQKNYTPYDGDGAFLAPATARTTALREKFDALLAEEREKGGVRNIDTETVITITAFGPGYLDGLPEVCRPMSRSSVHAIRSAACVWSVMRASSTATRFLPRLRRSSSTTRPTTTAYSPHTPRTFVKRVTLVC